MAVHRVARVVAIEPVTPGVKRFELALADGSELGFRGGQYLIVDTGVVTPEGKAAKRAYSLISRDDEQRTFAIAVKEIGPGARALHAATIGDTFSFSGPWGKLHCEEPRGRTLVVATDTGMTAALGTVGSAAFATRREDARVVWLVTESERFLPVDEVRARLGDLGLEVRVETALAIHHPERAAHALARLAGDLAVDDALLAGDGQVIFPLRDALVAAGVAAERVKLEAFFNNPARKAP